MAHSTTFRLGGDLEIRRLGFGAMRITGKGIWGEPADHAGSIAVLKRAVELGVNFIDTADSYGPDVSERLIGEALHPYADGLVIATKAGLTRSGPDRWHTNGKPEHIRAAIEGSLKRLKLETIDLYQLHRIDPEVPAEVSLGVFADLQREGKIRHIGLSEVTVEQIDHARSIVPIVSVQNRYNVGDREWENIVKYCEQHEIGFIPWFPLAAGKLTETGGTLDQIAHKHDASHMQIAIAWLLHHSPVILPIPGTSSVKHLEENMAAEQIQLDADDMAALDALGNNDK
ncbi:MAG: aldo/keto reductase [Herpetosiphon sp.]|nr:aldo/keto reductase [Herpetosiphon sp.]